MLFSIITPSRNQGRYISHCLDSIYAQSHCEVEHFVMDGQSDDDTATVVARYPSLFMQQVDTGPAQAINRGLEMVTGDIVCWLNADDAFAGPTVLSAVAELFRQHPEIDVITGDGYYIDGDGRLLHPIHTTRSAHMSLAWLKRTAYFLQPATFWRRNSIRLDERLHYTFDWQLWLDFYAASLNIFYVPQYFALYRWHPDSLTQQDPPLRRKEIYNLIARHGDSAIQRWWTWMAWKGYVLDQKLHTTVLRKMIRILNAMLGRATGGRVNHGA
jgi:glycosyltransferase involved in cell wall biosynthesis